MHEEKRKQLVEEKKMKNLKHDIGCRLVKIFAVVLATMPFLVCWYAVFADTIPMPFFNRGNWVIVTLFAALYIIFARVYDAFWISVNKPAEVAYSQILAVLVADAIMYIVIWLMNRTMPAIIPCLITLVVQVLLVTVWAHLAQRWYFASFPPAKTVVIYNHRSDVPGMFDKYNMDSKFDLQATMSVQECVSDLSQLDAYKAVFVCDVQSHDRNMILKYCVAKDITAYVLPRIGDIIMSGAHKMHIFHLPILRVGRRGLLPEHAIAKRIMDIAFSLVGLILLSPVMLITAIAIKATDGGPVLYKQTRLTKNGKQFRVWKFRSMRTDAEKDGKAVLSTGEKDDRITPVGRIIRKVRIDELPQLFNVLWGQMSLVGPRPERPEIAAQYEEVLPEFRLRLQAKAGLTGYAQVYGKYNTTPYDKLQMDLMYIANPSFLEDLRILMATVKILFVPESTEGVGEDYNMALGQNREEREMVGAGSNER
jgi:exopolysaccharide biosynthesis polyprenyl glycosylphosphotransferase